MHSFTVTTAIIRNGDFDFATKTIRGNNVYDAIARATAYAGKIIVMETEIAGRVTTWMTLDELEYHLAA